jgi:hypothetical protein
MKIYVDNRPIKVQQEEDFERVKDWEIERNVFLNPYDKSKFHYQAHIYKWFLKWKKENK